MVKNWNELSIGRYNDLMRVAKNSDGGDDLRDLVEVIAVLSGLTTDEVTLLPLATFRQYSNDALFIYSPLPEADASKVNKRIKIGGYTLRACLESRYMNASQFIDFQTYARMDDDDNKTVGLLSCLLVPEGMKYADGYDVLDVQRAIRENLSIVDAQNYAAFFLQWFRGYCRGMLIYSRWILRRIKDETKKAAISKKITETISYLNGGGSLGWTQFPSFAALPGSPFYNSELPNFSI